MLCIEAGFIVVSMVTFGNNCYVILQNAVRARRMNEDSYRPISRTYIFNGSNHNSRQIKHFESATALLLSTTLAGQLESALQ